MASIEDGKKRPFLGDEEGDHEAIAPAQRSKTHRVLFILQIAFLAVNLALLFWNSHLAQNFNRCEMKDNASTNTYTPARSALQYTVEEIHAGSDHNPFSGPPRPEVDQAWSQLLRGGIIKISEDELRRLNKTSIPLQDGSGYIGYLESIHMLHCKRIYQSQYPEQYPELQGTDAFAPGHWDHCLEVLRQGIICNADITVNTYYWKDGEIQGNRTGARTCTNWERISE
ncbi:hypothetical protein BO71DRAFT_425608 [Aspergillus ellipticus CBS 707.79]|uniref:Tat pathway signal sequence n=1 Tax=Aspergillus ellipticus CBS 707.79 TaxID=1448320 RepID=A0A319DR52_9EURO|nr:hypothetical protein BO71DRAFT_425608 [Aspergillus ellipticus CBS 707.79]